MKINVTQNDINQGRIASADCCPVARAIRRQTGREALVGPMYCDISDQENIPLPEEVRRFICDFDCGIEGKPFSFYLDI